METKNFVNPNLIKNLFQHLNKSEIEYVLIKNINAELPCGLKKNKDIDLLVKLECVKEFSEILLNNQFVKISHPQSRESGWQLAYGASDCVMFSFIEEGFEVDIHCELCLKSLMGNIWIPMDKYINNRVWVKKVWDEENNWWIIDDKVQLVYLISRCIFDKGVFSDVYISEITKRRHLLYDKTVQKMFELVFFNFAGKLIDLLQKNRYHEIIRVYYAFSDY